MNTKANVIVVSTVLSIFVFGCSSELTGEEKRTTHAAQSGNEDENSYDGESDPSAGENEQNEQNEENEPNEPNQQNDEPSTQTAGYTSDCTQTCRAFTRCQTKECKERLRECIESCFEEPGATPHG